MISRKKKSTNNNTVSGQMVKMVVQKLFEKGDSEDLKIIWQTILFIVRDTMFWQIGNHLYLYMSAKGIR